MQLSSLLGTKLYQKQGFLQDGKRIPLTAVNVMGNTVIQIKTSEKEGYNAIQLGIGKSKKPKKSRVGHSKKAGLEQTVRFLKEVKVEDTQGANLGSQINISEVFAPGDTVDVTGVSKGKGFAGGVKRHHFKGGPRTHGQSDRERAPGSIGQTTTPGRVYRGKKMAGRMGSDTVTVKNLEVIEVTDDGVLLIKGLIPGNINGLVVVKKRGTNKKFVPLYKEQVEKPQPSEESLRSPQEENQEQGNGSSSVSEDAQQASSENSETSENQNIGEPEDQKPEGEEAASVASDAASDEPKEDK